MNLKYLFILIISGVIIITCNGNKKPQVTHNNKSQIPVSGMIKAGYRNINLHLSGEMIEVTVFRGDYIKFRIDDQQNSQAGYQLQIPSLKINTVLNAHASDQPFFKMKQTGDYNFQIGDQMGLLHVVNLEQANYSELTSEEAWRLLNKNPPFLLDVRSKSEYRQGYIKGAVLIPLDEIQKRIAELDRYKNQPILIYCATGNRSTTASKILLDKEFKNVMNLRNGIVGWASKGYDVQFQ